MVYHFVTVNNLRRELRSLTEKNKALTDKFSKLAIEYSKLQTDYNKLSEEHDSLKMSHAELKMKYSELESKYTQLSAVHKMLEQKYSTLESKYQQVSNIATLLNRTLTTLHQQAMELCCTPYAFRRVLNMDEVRKTAPYVAEAGVRADDPFYSVQRIYEWIRKRVTYTNDTVTLVLHQSLCFEFDGKTYCVYTPVELPQQVQTPEFTAKTGRGDCDDQAILAYAMIKYYFIHVHGRNYDLWLATVRFSDGTGHLAVFLPVAGGKLTIIDPAGSYLTSERFLVWQSIEARNPFEELDRYERHLQKRMESITLYRIDVETGSYQELITGDKTTIATFIQRAG